MPSPPYVELHAHSAFSFLDGASLPAEMAERAARLGHEALALTDHDGLCGSLEFAHAAAAAGVRPITGAELTVTTDPHPGARHVTDDRRIGDGHLQVTVPGHRRHLTLLAIDARGYANLCRLITMAHAHTRDAPDRRAGDPLLPLDALEAHHEGLACLSGCARHGLVAAPLAAGRRAEAEAMLRRLVGIFGPGRTWVEIQRPGLRGDRALARALEALADHVGVPAVATGDVHAHLPRRAFLQDALVAVRHRRTLDASEEMRRGNRQAVLV
ncbi:MAG: PHP domain-containing protein, partial [Actinobacteria bacterium]|nr:PHP domain-containing protein [Actinomycetota bacterium]